MPDLTANPADASEDEPNNERTARQTQPDRLRQSGKSNRQSAQPDTENDTNKEWNELCLAQVFDRVANGRGGFLEILVAPDNREHDRKRHGEISGQWNGAPIKTNRLLGQRILECENAPPALEVCDYGDAVENS